MATLLEVLAVLILMEVFIYGLELDVLFQDLLQQTLLMHLVVEQLVLILDKKHNLETVMVQIYKMKEYTCDTKFLEDYGQI